jgi:hypothetical protein
MRLKFLLTARRSGRHGRASRSRHGGDACSRDGSGGDGSSASAGRRGRFDRSSRVRIVVGGNLTGAALSGHDNGASIDVGCKVLQGVSVVGGVGRVVLG